MAADDLVMQGGWCWIDEVSSYKPMTIDQSIAYGTAHGSHYIKAKFMHKQIIYIWDKFILPSKTLMTS